MKIKKLTLHGFKSFVDRTTLNFPAGTSGVIGPNGCGKSNIVDAIRWVLGEQNARHLRGKLMEDVIFNGSDSRKPLGMAEVVLTFSNDQGQAPASFANFTEIEIARRLYRSGESEYYINKVPSRLRDIVDLFSDTGIGTRAYSIIEQGQVGWLINAKPEERRAVFEEAAGISKFKHKKEAALRRLEAAKENLTRVNDIISEVKRQLNSLNRQAKKAERYKALKEELTAVDLKLAAKEYRRLAAEISETSKKLNAIKDNEAALTAELSAKDAMAEEVRSKHSALEAQYRSVKDNIYALEKEIQNAERAGELARLRMAEIKRSDERLSLEIAELDCARQAAFIENDALQKNLSEIGALITRDSARLAQVSARLEGLAAGHKAKEEERRSKAAEILKKASRLSEIRHAIQSQIKDEEYSRIKESKAITELDALSKAVASKEGPLARLKIELAYTLSRKDGIETEVSGLRGEVNGLEGAVAGQETALRALKDDFSKAEARLTTLEEMERNFESLASGPKAMMQSAPRADGFHLMGLLADAIETNQGFEKAVEAALGDKLQYILVESHNAGMEAIEYLKRTGAGRVSFAPVRETRQISAPVTVPAGVGFDGAKELIAEVRVRDEFQNVINSLLGDVLVAETLSGAIDLWRQCFACGLYKTVVTADGDVIAANGIITGGTQGSGEGILQKKSEIKNIRASCAALETKMLSAEAGLNSSRQSLAAAKSLLEEKKERLHAVEIERLNVETGTKTLEDEVLRLTNLKASAEDEIREATGRLAECHSKKTALSAERTALEKEVTLLEDGMNAVTMEISVIDAQKEEISASVTEIKVALASGGVSEGAIKRQSSEKTAFMEESAAKAAAKKAEMEAGLDETAAKAAEAAEEKTRAEGLLYQVEAIKTDEVGLAETLALISTDMNGIESSARELKARHSELQELKGELSIELKEDELGIANLKDRITEKYGRDIAHESAVEMAAAEQEGQSAEGDAHHNAPLDMEALESQARELREKIGALGEVSLSALEEYNDLDGRHQFLVDQQTDLNKSVESLMSAITRINRTSREKFMIAFEEINAKFKETFPRFFRGGKAEVRLAEEMDVLEAGIEIIAQPPGKKLQNITLLSGGEKALTATALIFAIFLTKPSPFCILDEVDAPLDDANIDRFNMFVKDMSQLSQFILITHNKKTMEMADSLYGVTMEEPGVSKMLSVSFPS